jgi:hypothetical protein
MARRSVLAPVGLALALVRTADLDLVVRVIPSANLIGQLAKPLACRLSGDELGHTATLTTASAKHGGPRFDPVQSVDEIRSVDNQPPGQQYVGGTCYGYAAHGMVAASEVPTPAGLLTER